MKVVDIATEIYRELGEPTDTSIPPIAYWLRANIGKLNSALNKSYYEDSTTLEIVCVSPDDETVIEEIGADEVAIFKLIYHIHYYDLLIRRNALSYNTSKAIEMSSDGHTVRLVSPTEVGKALYMFRKNLGDELRQWVNWYRMARATPRQVTGDDTVEQDYYYGRPIYRGSYIYNV